MSSLFLNLPEEIHEDIFLRLPAESILFSRCVCKILHNLLTKPSFIKDHLDRTIQCKPNPKLLFVRLKEKLTPEIYTLPIDYASISSAQECEGSLLMYYPFQSKKFDSLQVLGSCNGLVCFRIFCSVDRAAFDWASFVKTEYFSILNPLTKEYRKFKLPQYSGNREPRSSDYNVIHGFGYDRNIDDYKLVMISDYECADCMKIDVYRVKSDSWSSVQGMVDYSFPTEEEGCHGVFLNGAIHWKGTTTQETSLRVIISFDISNETIVDIPLPPESIVLPMGYQWDMLADVGVWGDCICVAFMWSSDRIEMWVMQEYGVQESWSRKFTITEKPWTTFSFWKPLWCYGNGKILIHDLFNEELVLCDPTTETVRSVVVHGIMDYRESYVESIVSLGSGTYLKKQRLRNHKMELRPRGSRS